MQTASLAELNRRFGITGMAQIVSGNGGLAKVQIDAPASAGEMYLHGGHVTSWKPAGAEEALFVSPQSRWQEGVAIRGGVPICFPWFGDKAGDPDAPAHGFVRTKPWQLESIEQNGEAVSVTMSTHNEDSTRKWWPHDFLLLHRATFGAELLLELIMTNSGSAALQFEEAMHAYYSVGDATQAAVSGLHGVQYLDKTDSYRQKLQQGDVTITSETDRVYLNTPHPLELSDPISQRKITVTKKNSLTTVVWNPWSERGDALADLGKGEWKKMLCIEVTNVGDYAVHLQPGQQHIMQAKIALIR